MKQIIWQYWEGPKTDFVRLCMKTVKKNKGDFEYILVNKDSIKDFLPNLRNEIYDLKRIAHRADYIRFKLLEKYGGWWLDSDCVLYKDFNHIHQQLIDSEKDFCSTGHFPIGKPSIWFMGSKPNGAIVKKHCLLMDNKINNRGAGNIKWSEIGCKLLWLITNEENYLHLNVDLICPVPYTEYKLLLRNDLELKDITNQNSFGFVFFNEMYRANNINILAMSEKELLSQNNLMSKILQKGLR
jgi:hypothetical protein